MSQLFPKFLPKEVRFIRGETPTPEKLSSAFRQLESAFFMLESFLGNGIDYNLDEYSDRKMLFNLSSAVGSTDKLYQPVNKVPTLKRVYRKFGKSTCTYYSATDELAVTSSGLATTIACEADAGYEFGIYYKGRGKIVNVDGPEVETVLAPAATWTWTTLTLPEDIEYFRLKAYDINTELRIKSLYVAKKIDGRITNKAYSIAVDNNAYFTLKTPCVWANPESTDRCEVRTCDYCIGNTYELDPQQTAYGMAKCSDAYYLDGITQMPITYATDVSTPRKDYVTLQSPVLTESKQYAIKYKPYYCQGLPQDTEIPQNASIVYDTKNPASPVRYTTKLFASGVPNIFYAKDKNELSVGMNDPKRYIVLSSVYGLTDLLYDLMEHVELPVPITAMLPDEAVYAE